MLSRRELHHLDQTPAFAHKLEFQKQQLEAQAAYDEIHRHAQVTPEEINQYYAAHSANYDEIMVRQFVIRKKTVDPKADPAHPTPAGQGLAADEAKARAEAIRKELAAGTDIKKVIEDFKAPGDVTIEAEPRTGSPRRHAPGNGESGICSKGWRDIRSRGYPPSTDFLSSDGA